jgi:tRNA dimethylallyltransferase
MGLVNKLLIVIGPTAVGKTAVSLVLAERLDGEIISVDSRLFYRGMDIGTAKPSPADMQRVPHHLIGICDPDQTLTLGEYQRLAYSKIDMILAEQRLPLLVGGTGQYVMAVAEGWGIPEVAPQAALREQLEQLGGLELSRWLAELDPISTAKIDYRNERRVIRALEVALITGHPISKLQQKNPPGYDICWIGLHRDRESLYKRIDLRVEQMINDGLVEEVQSLRAAGYGRKLPSMSGLGYRQIYAYLDGELSFQEAVERIKFETHRLARQQNTWFKREDPRINWIDLDQDETMKALLELAQHWLGK